MRLNFTLFFALLINISFSQITIYHNASSMLLEKPLTEYVVGDTLKTYDVSRNMTLYGVFLSVKLSTNLKLHYSDSSGVRTIEVGGFIQDSILYWHGKCIENDLSSKHTIISFYRMNKYEGVQYYFVGDCIQTVESSKMNNKTRIGIDKNTGKLAYYWMMDSLGILNGVDLYFHKNGELMSCGYNHNGDRIGNWYYYNDQGRIVKIECYRKGILVKTKKKRIMYNRKPNP